MMQQLSKSERKYRLRIIASAHLKKKEQRMLDAPCNPNFKAKSKTVETPSKRGCLQEAVYLHR